MWFYVAVALVQLIAINLYFRVAAKLEIIDRPNQRSSHRATTIRGGGVIFPISYLLYLIYAEPVQVYFAIGLVLIR